MRDIEREVRRRSPAWVRSMTSREVHGIVGRFDRVRRTGEGLTPQQEWLWDALISELEYRHRRPPEGERRCCCLWCLPPESGWEPEEPF